jgi:tetratricopeptide (TPR) repeat protein
MKEKSAYIPFAVAIAQDPGLIALRKEYAALSKKKRRMAADYEYHAQTASEIFNQALFMHERQSLPKPIDYFVPLAIDPLFAPAILTVGSLDYLRGYKNEAMGQFLSLTTLSAKEPELAQIIDEAGTFLCDKEDYTIALTLYEAALTAFPKDALFYAGASFCHAKLGKPDAALSLIRKAVDLEPDNHLHLNDLGFTLLVAGDLDEAETYLRRSAELAPAGYEHAKNNLEFLFTKKKKTDSGKG